MVGVPKETPVTIPLDEPTVASDKLLLVQVPPAIPSVNEVVCPTHTRAVPDIDDGIAFTVNGTVW